MFTILFLDVGLTLQQFALLNAVWAATIVVREVPSGALANTIGSKNLLVFTGVSMILEMALLCFVPLGNASLLFAVFLVNRVLSGTAEAAASGADEALAYGCMDLMYSGLLVMLRQQNQVKHISGTNLGDSVFIESIGWFPGYFIVGFLLIWVLGCLRLRHTQAHQHKG